VGCVLIAAAFGGLGVFVLYVSTVLGFFLFLLTAIVTQLAGIIGLVLLI
jgi:hypothetical protein